MTESAPPPPNPNTINPTLIQERIAYDSYFDAAGNPIDLEVAIDTVSDTASGNMAYYGALRTAAESARASGESTLFPDAVMETPYKLGDRAAISPGLFHTIKTDLERGTLFPGIAELYRSSLDGQAPILSNPYELPAETRPAYSSRFHDAFESTLRTSQDHGIRSGESWVAARDKAASTLQRALRDHPEQIGFVQDALTKLEANAKRAEASTKKAQDRLKNAELRHDDAKETVRTGHFEHQPREGSTIIELPAGMTAIEPPPAGTDMIEYYNSALKSALVGVKKNQAGVERRIEIAGYVAELRARALNPTFFLAKAALTRSVALTGHDGVESMKLSQGQDTQKYERFKQIVAGIAELGPNSDPEIIQKKFGWLETAEDVASYKFRLDADMLEWRVTGSETAEHNLFNKIHNTRKYLRSVRGALDTMSPYNERYASLYQIHGELSQISNVATYQLMSQRHQNASANGYDAKGRYPVHHLPDMGLRQEDGTAVVYYPDGSTSYMTSSNVLGRRLNADGSSWAAPAAEEPVRRSIRGRLRRSNETGDRPQSGTTAELETQYQDVSNVAFINPSGKNRETAKRYAVAVLDQAQADAQTAFEQATTDKVKYVDDADTRVAINRATYNAVYHTVEPGVMPARSDPYVRPKGDIYLPTARFYGQEGAWVIWPNGALQLLDASNNVVRAYYAGGKRIV